MVLFIYFSLGKYKVKVSSVSKLIESGSGMIDRLIDIYV